MTKISETPSIIHVHNLEIYSESDLLHASDKQVEIIKTVMLMNGALIYIHSTDLFILDSTTIREIQYKL